MFFRRKYYTNKRPIFKIGTKNSRLRFWTNCRKNNRQFKVHQYTNEQIQREYKSSRSRSTSKSSLRHTIYSESFEQINRHRLSRSPSPQYKYEHTALVALHKCSPIVYSDLYFKHGMSLNARIYENGCLIQSVESNILYQRNRSKLRRYNLAEMSEEYSTIDCIFEPSSNFMPLYLSDDIKTRNFRGLIINYEIVSIDRIIINNHDFKNKCYQKQFTNEMNFNNYNAMIRLENSGDVFEEYFFEKSVEECYSRVKGFNRLLLEQKQRLFERRSPSPPQSFSRYNSSLSVKRQSPLSIRRASSQPTLPLSQSILNLLNIDKYNLENKPPDVIEKILLRRQKVIDQIRSGSYDLTKIDLNKSLEHFNDPMLVEPLLSTMQEVSQQDYYSRRARTQRLKQQRVTRFMIAYTMALFITTFLVFYILYFR